MTRTLCTPVVRLLSALLLAGLLLVTSCHSGDDSDDLDADVLPAVTIPVAAAFQTGLPVLTITTPDSLAVTSKTEWLTDAQVTLQTTDGTTALQTQGAIRGRGNVSWQRYSKKSYNLKLDIRESLLGMAPAKRWVLLANWADRTLLRNDVAFECSRRTSLRWTPASTPVELVLNGVYRGSYLLCEKVQVDRHRLDIDVMTAADEDDETITGGYLLEIDEHFDEAHKFRSAVYRLPYQFREPDDDVLTERQFYYMADYVESLERSLANDKALRAGDYEAWIDAQSFADWWIVNEFCHNVDAAKPRSFFVYKPRGGRLTAGPVWDFDFCTFTLLDDIYIASRFPYLHRLFQSPRFLALARQRWALLRPQLETLPDYIDRRAAVVRASAANNIQMWPITATKNQDEQLSFDEAVERMKQSVPLRLSVIDRFLAETH